MVNLIRYNRKYTDVEEFDELLGDNLSLYKHNSTFVPTVLKENTKYGDNVYIQQIMALKRNESVINRNYSNKENNMN